MNDLEKGIVSMSILWKIIKHAAECDECKQRMADIGNHAGIPVPEFLRKERKP